jgi:hypothetical protein
VPNNYYSFVIYFQQQKIIIFYKLVPILNNEASMLESFFQIFSMADGYFSEFLTNSKINN